MEEYYRKSLEEHERLGGKLRVESTMPVSNKGELSIAYTPGVAEPVRAIVRDPSFASRVVSTKRMVAVVTDGSAVLGLGDVGPEASLPVMEGKAVLFQEFAGISAFPIALNTQDVDEIVDTVFRIAPTFGGINLEDISAPRCFEIEEKLQEKLSIPVFHDDQHGTAIVVLAGVINSLALAGKEKEEVRVVVNGAGAAGIAIAKLLHAWGVSDIIVCDSKGIIAQQREDLSDVKRNLLSFTNADNVSGDMAAALRGADVFVGVSVAGLLNAEHVQSMKEKPVIFAMANPDPEILPDDAKNAGAYIIATGRSDFPNQLNNVLAFPGIFKGAFESGARCITREMCIGAAYALAECVSASSVDRIIPGPFDAGVADAVADAVARCA